MKPSSNQSDAGDDRSTGDLDAAVEVGAEALTYADEIGGGHWSWASAADVARAVLTAAFEAGEIVTKEAHRSAFKAMGEVMVDAENQRAEVERLRAELAEVNEAKGWYEKALQLTLDLVAAERVQKAKVTEQRDRAVLLLATPQNLGPPSLRGLVDQDIEALLDEPWVSPILNPSSPETPYSPDGEKATSDVRTEQEEASPPPGTTNQ